MVDVEILNRLKALLSLNVYMEVPDDAPEEFYVIQFVKGECRHGLAEMSIIAQSYGNTMYRACDMNKDMEAALESLITEDYIRDISRNGSYPYNKTDIKQYRYQCLFDVSYYES